MQGLASSCSIHPPGRIFLLEMSDNRDEGMYVVERTGSSARIPDPTPLGQKIRS